MTVLVSADVEPTAARTGALLLADGAGVLASLDQVVTRQLTGSSPQSRRLVALSQPARTALLDELLTGLRSLLDDELTDLLVDAWSGHRTLVSAGRETGKVQGGQSIVRLAPHTVRVQQDPELDLRVDGMQLLTLRVRLDIAFVVNEAVLLVHDGRLVEVRADNPKVYAVLWVDGEEISRRAGRLVMGAGLKLDDGVRLSPWRGLVTKR